MLLHLTDLSEEPLHHQISRQIRAKVLAGELVEGDSLPSIRGLAKASQVSVITVQRAYDDLSREGLIAARRGKGFFVAAVSADLRHRLARERFLDALKPVVRDGRADGLTDAQILELTTTLVESKPPGGPTS